jgi:phosphoserine aminotransferase
MYATPPAFNCYLAGKMFKWIKAQGGVDALYQINVKKAARLYQFIDSSPFYHCAVEPGFRSLMNVCFTLTNPDLEDAFLQQAKARGLCALKGHRMVGGLRASLYNAMPVEGVEALIAFMQDFAS